MRKPNFWQMIVSFNNLSRKNERKLQKRIERALKQCIGSKNFTHEHAIKPNYRRGVPDGTLYLKGTKGALELKYTKASGYKYSKHLTQVLCYHLLQEQYKVLFLVSETYFDYILVDENKEAIRVFKSKYGEHLKTYIPRTISENVETDPNLFKIHRHIINENTDLREILSKVINYFE